MTRKITKEDKQAFARLVAMREEVELFQEANQEKLDSITKESPWGAIQSKKEFFDFVSTLDKTIEQHKDEPNCHLINPCLIPFHDTKNKVFRNVEIASLDYKKGHEIYRDLQRLNRYQADDIFENLVKYPFDDKEGLSDEEQKQLDRAYMFGYMKAVNELGEYVSRLGFYIDFEDK